MLTGSTPLPRLAHGDARTAKLDATPWAGGVAFASYGVRLGVRVDDPRALQRLPPYLPPVREPLSSGEVDHLFSLRKAPTHEPRFAAGLYQGARLVRRATALDTAMKLDLLRSLIERQIVMNAPALIFVHAGVVEWQGRAILVPGRSRSGKTTLVTALLRAGARYYSDELAVLDASGRVHPWARPLRIRRAGRQPRSYDAERFGERAPQSALPVGLVVFTTHRRGAHWRPRPLSPGQAVLALLRHTHVARRRPEEAIRVLGCAVRGARAIAGARGEAEALALELLSGLDA